MLTLLDILFFAVVSLLRRTHEMEYITVRTQILESDAIEGRKI